MKSINKSTVSTIVPSDNSGFVALVTVMVMIIIFSMMIIAGLQIAVNNRNYNLDDRLSEQAILAAESGAEELIDLTRKKLIEASGDSTKDLDWVKAQVNAETCDIPDSIKSSHGVADTSQKLVPLSSGGDETGSAFGCQKIDLSPNAIFGNSGDGASRSILMPKDVHRIDIAWFDDAGSTGTATSYTGRNPPHINWNGSAALIVQAIAVRSDANSSDEASTFVRPTGGGGSGNISTDAETSGNCSSGECKVSLTIDSVVSADTVEGWLRLTPIYKAAHYSIEAYDASGNQLSFGGGVATVDSTGKAGDVWSRVEKQVDFGSSTSDIAVPFESVYAGGSICKNFTFKVEEDGSISKNTDPANPCP